MIYDSRSFNVVLDALTVWHFIMPGNRNRVALNISSDGTTVANGVLQIATGPRSRLAFVQINPEDPISLPYRDWGPVIKEPIYASIVSLSYNATFTEIFLIHRRIGE